MIGVITVWFWDFLLSDSIILYSTTFGCPHLYVLVHYDTYSTIMKCLSCIKNLFQKTNPPVIVFLFFVFTQKVVIRFHMVSLNNYRNFRLKGCEDCLILLKSWIDQCYIIDENLKVLDSHFVLVWNSSAMRIYHSTHGTQTQDPRPHMNV